MNIKRIKPMRLTKTLSIMFQDGYTLVLQVPEKVFVKPISYFSSICATAKREREWTERKNNRPC